MCGRSGQNVVFMRVNFSNFYAVFSSYRLDCDKILKFFIVQKYILLLSLGPHFWVAWGVVLKTHSFLAQIGLHFKTPQSVRSGSTTTTQLSTRQQERPLRAAVHCMGCRLSTLTYKPSLQ